eukprot:313323_1
MATLMKSSTYIFSLLIWILSVTCQTQTFTTTADLPLVKEAPTSYWNTMVLKIAPIHDFHPEYRSTISINKPKIACTCWWTPNSGSGNDFAPVAIAYTAAIIDEVTLEILEESPLTDLVYKSYSYLTSYHEPWMNIYMSENPLVNAHIAYMMNLNNLGEWKRIGIKITSQTNGIGVSTKVNWGGNNEISFIITNHNFPQNSNQGNTVSSEITIPGESDGTTIDINCSSRKIQILQGSYGANACGSALNNALNHLHLICNGLSSCQYTINSNKFIHQGGVCLKTFVYEYKCVDIDSCRVIISAHGDNTLSIEHSNDGGNLYMPILYTSDFNIIHPVLVNDFDINTILKFTVVDTGSQGAFIATVNFIGKNGILTFPTDMSTMGKHYSTVSSTDGNTNIIENTGYISSPYGSYFGNGNSVGNGEDPFMDTDAYWIWNGNVNNIMTFQFDFSNYETMITGLCNADKYATLDTINSVNNDASVILDPEGVGNSEVSISNNEWNILANTYESWSMSVSLNNQWGFSSTQTSIIIFTIYGTTPFTSIDMDMITSFSVNNQQYVSSLLQNAVGEGNWFGPSCDISIYPLSTLMYHGDIETAILTGSGDRHARSGSDAGFWEPYGSDNGWPIIFTIENNPIYNIMKISVSNPVTNSIQKCGFSEAFIADQGLDLFIGLHNYGEQMSIERFDVELYLIQSTPPYVELTVPKDNVDGASVILDPTNINNETSINNNQWEINSKTDFGWQMLINLDSRWVFSNNMKTILTFTVFGTSPVGGPDSDLLAAFSVGQSEYIFVTLNMDNLHANRISGNTICDTSLYPTENIMSGDIEQSVITLGRSQISATETVLFDPQNPTTEYNDWPMIYVIENDPSVPDMFFSVTNPQRIDIQQCGYGQSYTTNNLPNIGLQIYLGCDNDLEYIAIEKFRIQLELIPITTSPTNAPSIAPSIAPSHTPTQPPTLTPSTSPTIAPSISPSIFPTQPPTLTPSITPSLSPTISPSLNPSLIPTQPPSLSPSISPTQPPSISPSLTPTQPPSISPSKSPTTPPSLSPTQPPSL